MRYEGRRVLTSGRRNGVAVAVATALVLGAVWPANAAVPIVEGAVGEAAGLALFQPFDAGYTDVSVSSSNADVVRVGRIEKPSGGGFNYTLQGPGIGVLTVTWSNPIDHRVLQGYYVVASGVIVDGADTLVLTRGQMMLLAVPRVLRANPYVGNTVFASDAVVSASVQRVGVQLTARGVGTSFVNIELAADERGIPHHRLVIVTVIEASQPATFF